MHFIHSILRVIFFPQDVVIQRKPHGGDKEKTKEPQRDYWMLVWQAKVKMISLRWQILADFGLMDFDIFWQILADYGWFRLTLADFGWIWRILADLADFGRFWPILDDFGGFWCIILEFPLRLWSIIKMKYGKCIVVEISLRCVYF